MPTQLDNKGDMMSLICVWVKDGVDEIKHLLNSRNYYVGVNGRMNFSANNDVIELVLKSMTG
jgi:hypothetical protein